MYKDFRILLSQCNAQMKISFPGLIFVQYKSINIIIIIIIIILAPLVSWSKSDFPYIWSHARVFFHNWPFKSQEWPKSIFSHNNNT